MECFLIGDHYWPFLLRSLELTHPSTRSKMIIRKISSFTMRHIGLSSDSEKEKVNWHQYHPYNTKYCGIDKPRSRKVVTTSRCVKKQLYFNTTQTIIHPPAALSHAVISYLTAIASNILLLWKIAVVTVDIFTHSILFLTKYAESKQVFNLNYFIFGMQKINHASFQSDYKELLRRNCIEATLHNKSHATRRVYCCHNATSF